MNKATLLADAMDARSKKADACNGLARKLIAQMHPFLSNNAETVLSGEYDEAMSLMVDLVDARGELKTADNEYEALKRRVQ